MKTAALTMVNQHILEVAVETSSDEPLWEFFCECGQADCYEHVDLTVGQYVAIRESGQEVLAPGHRPSQVARAARLREEANALRAQAEHQVERARRAEHGVAAAPLRAGERVWVNGRPGIFRQHMPGGRGARVRFDGESRTHVVSLARLRTQPPAPRPADGEDPGC